MSKLYSWIASLQSGPKEDRSSKSAAIALLRRRGYGQVWTADGSHLVAWFEDGRLVVIAVQ
jgi:hypothetical protein